MMAEIWGGNRVGRIVELTSMASQQRSFHTTIIHVSLFCTVLLYPPLPNCSFTIALTQTRNTQRDQASSDFWFFGLGFRTVFIARNTS